MNTHLINLASRIINQPLLITPAKLEAIISLLGPRFDSAAEHGILFSGPAMDEQVVQSALVSQARKPGQTVGDSQASIAIIPVIGSMVNRSGGMDGWSGLRSYESIRRDLRTALNDPEIDAIMLDVDSHGGEVSGCFDLVDEIYQARGQKKIYAFANESAYSAGYAIFSAAEKSFVSRTSGVGSVGVIIMHADRSGMNEKLGVKYTAVYAGARKNDFSPHQPLSAEARKKLQDEVESTRDIFIATVARNRAMDKEIIAAHEAGFYTGAQAVAQGLADAVATWQEALEHLAGDCKSHFFGGSQMNTKDRFAALLKGNDDAVAALSDLGFVRADAAAEKKALEEAQEKGCKEGLTAGFSQAVDLINLCSLAGLPEMAEAFIKAGATVDQARSQLLEHKAKLDEQQKTNSTFSGTKAPVENTFIAACQAVAEGGK